MSRIKILPPAVADQIAAGEVVERPYSVVKELVENAIDAGAASVDITVEDGGKGLIRVSDDGSGMTQAEALLALERHATSKIRSATDLVGVRSFGFRGEALPSISSVSDLELETAVADGPGVLVRSDAGIPKLVSDVTRRRGTTVSVAALFHNVPARKKFMRSERSEWRAIHNAIVMLALTRLAVRFHVVHDGRQALSLPAATTLQERVAQIWGAVFADRLLSVDNVSGTTHTSGLVERPSDVGTATRRIHILVNGRSVRDNGLVRAAEAAYKSTVPSGVRPSLFLSVVVPGDSVDVNVHPAKAEIRFQDRWPVERCVENAVRRALGTLESGAYFGRNHHFFPGAAARGGGWTTREIGADAGGFLRTVRDDGPLLSPAALEQGGAVSAVATAPETANAGVGELDADIDVPHLTQLHRTYLLFEREDGIVLIDQHSAHERVLFENFMRDLERGDSSGQRLLFPLTLHLGPAEAEAFEQNRPVLEKLGFETEGFGGHTLLVRAVPMPHPRFDAERCLRDTLAALTGDRSASSGAKHERLAATVACKAAIKAGDQLTQPEMRALFVALARTQLPAHDVHGRAVVVQLSWEEVERRLAGDSVRVICGPTAAGKSALAMRLAAEFGGRIVSADSRQVYRGFDIGTAKPTALEQKNVRHYCIDGVDPEERYSAAVWADQAQTAIQETITSDSVPMIVGGTGFYLRALFTPLFHEPDFDDQRRAALEAHIETMPLDDLRRWCVVLDPARSHLGRTQLMRAIQVALLSGERLSALHEQNARHAQWRARYLLVDPGGDLAATIEKRVHEMMERGWEAEVARLDAALPEDAPAWKATGYRSIRALVRGTMSRSDALADVVTRTRQYAKRQRTWFRNQLRGERVTVVDGASDAAFQCAVDWWQRNDEMGELQAT